MAGLSDYLGVAAGAASAIPGIGGIASAALSGLGALFGAESDTEREVKASKELMQYQNRIAVENWNRQNEYNHPLKQMERLASAGLNPHLVYGQGAQTLAANLTQPSAGAKGGKADYAGVGIAAAQNYAAVQNLVEQNNNLKAQNDVLKEERNLKYEQVRRQRMENTKLATEVENYPSMISLDMAIKRGQVSIQNASLRKLQLDGDILAKDLANYDERYGYEISILAQRVFNLRAEEKNILSDTLLKEAQTKLAEAGVTLSQSQANYYRSGAALNDIEQWFKEWKKGRVQATGLDPDFSPELRLGLSIIAHLLGIRINNDGSIEILEDDDSGYSRNKRMLLQHGDKVLKELQDRK